MDLDICFLFSIFAFLASIIGAICGIGGGILIKPLLDAFGVLDVSTISFLSGCSVLAMTCYSVLKSKVSKESIVHLNMATPLAMGAAIGGALGKRLFEQILFMYENKDRVGAIQAVGMLVITLASLLYTMNKNKIKTYQITNVIVCVLIGLLLGITSSFLGIGGGPINIVVLFYFFSMDTKEAAQNSLYIILFSQVTSLLNTLFTHSIPTFDFKLLILMVGGGLLGGIVGRKINLKIDITIVSKLFVIVMVFILVLCSYNIVQFM